MLWKKKVRSEPTESLVTLNKQTIRKLNNRELDHIAGAVAAITSTDLCYTSGSSCGTHVQPPYC